MDTGKALGPSDITLQLIAASREVGIQVMFQLCLLVLCVLRILVEWDISMMVPIFKGKYDFNCSCYEGPCQCYEVPC